MTFSLLNVSKLLRYSVGSLVMLLGTIAVSTIPIAIVDAEEVPPITATLGFVSPPTIGEPAQLDLIVWAAVPVTVSTELILAHGVQIVDGELAKSGEVGIEGVWKHSMTLVVLSAAEFQISGLIEAYTPDGELIQGEKRLFVAAAPAKASFITFLLCLSTFVLGMIVSCLCLPFDYIRVPVSGARLMNLGKLVPNVSEPFPQGLSLA